MHDVVAHYHSGQLLENIVVAIQAQGLEPEELTLEDLAPLDAFHIRGAQATEALLQQVPENQSGTILDVGCGVGGSARLLASRRDVHVTGVDLIPEYVVAARQLSHWLGLNKKTDFKAASALALPFIAAQFAGVWTEHVQMNIEDKLGFYTEIHRVLKSSGCLYCNDVFLGTEPGLHLPLPWAEQESINHLMTFSDCRDLLERLGFEIIQAENTTSQALAWFDQQKTEKRSSSRLNLRLLMGSNARLKSQNVQRNLRDAHIQTWQWVARKW